MQYQWLQHNGDLQQPQLGCCAVYHIWTENQVLPLQTPTYTVDWSLCYLFVKQNKLLAFQCKIELWSAADLVCTLETHQCTTSSKCRCLCTPTPEAKMASAQKNGDIRTLKAPLKKSWFLFITANDSLMKQIVTMITLLFFWHGWVKSEDKWTEAHSYHRLTWTWQVKSWSALFSRLS